MKSSRPISPGSKELPWCWRPALRRIRGLRGESRSTGIRLAHLFSPPEPDWPGRSLRIGLDGRYSGPETKARAGVSAWRASDNLAHLLFSGGKVLADRRLQDFV